MEFRIRSLFLAGKHEALADEAEQLTEVQADGCSVGAVEQLAVATLLSGRLESAERWLRYVIHRAPEQVDCRLNLGVLLLRQTRYSEACELLLECLARDPRNPDVLFNLGLVVFAMGDFREAERYLRNYVVACPQDVTARLYLSRCCYELGNRNESEVLARGIQFEVLDGHREWYEWARLLTGHDQFEQAEAVYQQILARDPNETPALINWAGLRERANQLEESRVLLDRAGAAGETSPQYWLIRARLALAARKPEAVLIALKEAETRIDPLWAEAERASLRSEIEFSRGHAYDQSGRSNEAFAAFLLANQLVRDRYRAVIGRVSNGDAHWLNDQPRLDEVVRREQAVANGGASPIFLVGFPRSGTTLLDQILDAHSDVQVMEEKPALEAVAGEIEAHYGSLARGLAVMSSRELDLCRQMYWREVARYIQRGNASCFVDKYPLSVVRLQLGMILFPDARWIFTLRHPCDVVLSCFMQNFRFTDATHGFWTIGDTADIYARAMTLWLNQRERLNPICLDIRYEDLVSNLEMEARRLFSFLDLPWDEQVLKFHQHALKRRITTPSYRQVSQPIYRSAQGRWLAYWEFLKPVFYRLAPVAARLNYELSASEAENSRLSAPE